MKRGDCLNENKPSLRTTELKFFLFISTDNVQADAERKTERKKERKKERKMDGNSKRKEERNKQRDGWI